MILAMYNLNLKCKCGKRADYRVERTNGNLLDKYFESDTRGEEYCKDCLPKDAKDHWDSAFKR